MSLKGFIKGTKRVNWHVLCFVFTFLLALQRHTPSFIYDWVLNTSLYFFYFSTCIRDCAYGEDCDHLPLLIQATVLSHAQNRRFRMTYFISVKNLFKVRGVTFKIEEGIPVFLLKRFSQDFVQTFLKDFLRLHRNNPLNLGNHWDNYSSSGAKKY